MTEIAENILQQVVREAEWLLAREPQVRYQQKRPMEGIGRPHKLPLNIDCSAFVTLCYNWGDGPDPNGSHINGSGYTGTILRHCRRLGQSEPLRIGDLVVFGPDTGEHVVIVVSVGANPMVISHGGDYGPIKLSLAKEAKYHPAPVRRVRVPWKALGEAPDEGEKDLPIPADPSGLSNPPTEEGIRSE